MTNLINEIPIIYLIITLVILLFASAFFSGSETAMMALNRYKLKHLTKTSKSAKRVHKLISRPDKLLAVVLICNNFVNIYAATIAAIIGAKLLGDKGATIYAPICLTIILLIFGEITPKTLAATYPQRIALIAALPLKILLWSLSPIVKLVNILSNFILSILGIKKPKVKNDALTLEELHTVVSEASPIISDKHKKMLTSIINLKKMTVNDIMVPRLEVIGIDLDSNEQQITNVVKSSQHTVLPVYRSDLNKILGLIHMRDLASHAMKNTFNIKTINKLVQKPYFVPEGTSLYVQLLNFQLNKARTALVVDEYGDVQGIITLADILEEIVGQFTTDASALEQEIFPQPDGSTLVDGSINIRTLNEKMNWDLPTTGAKTLSGLIIEYLEFIPKPATCLSIAKYKIEVIQLQNKKVETVKFYKRKAD